MKRKVRLDLERSVCPTFSHEYDDDRRRLRSAIDYNAATEIQRARYIERKNATRSRARERQRCDSLSLARSLEEAGREAGRLDLPHSPLSFCSFAQKQRRSLGATPPRSPLHLTCRFAHLLYLNTSRSLRAAVFFIILARTRACCMQSRTWDRLLTAARRDSGTGFATTPSRSTGQEG